ncbi:MAG: tetratricopeptide repeat protein [Candidatus Binatus sp.]
MKSQPAIAESSNEAASTTLIWGLSPRQAAILAGIIVVTIAIYLPSLRNGWVLDDRQEFIDNKLIHSWSFVWDSFRYDNWWFRDPRRLPQSSYYRPLENVWFAANVWLFGLRPALWHLAKIGLHVIVVALCFRLAQLLAGSAAVALLAAAIFAVMPAHTGAVVFASAIPEPLSLAFELSAMILLVQRKPGWSRGLIGALMLYVCAILTHESAILFPLIVAAYLVIFERQRAVPALRTCAPFVVVVIAYMCVRLDVLGLKYLFAVHFEATGTGYVRGFEVWRPHYSLMQVLMTLPAALMTYLAVLTVPAVAGPAHDVDWVTHFEPIVLIEAAALIVLAAAAFVPAWRSSHRRIYLFCAVWIGLTMAPALNLNSLWWLVDDRYLYAPSFGWSLAVALAAVEIASAGSTARNAVGVALATLLALNAVSTMHAERYWHDDVTFFRRGVEIAPRFADYRLKLAYALNEAGDREGAMRVLEVGTALDPDNAHMHLKLAQQYQMMGRELDFMREFRKFNELSTALAERKGAPNAAEATPSP